MTEQGQAWHNMSAPPRSQIQVAPNRKWGRCGTSSDSQCFTTTFGLETVHHGLL